jgi:hypothetical protein
MGEVVRLADRRARPRSAAIGARQAVRAEFFFDLASPFTYLAAERVARAFDAVTWSPACARALRCRCLPTDAAALEAVVAHAEARAGVLRLPLEWPERWPAPVPAAMPWRTTPLTTAAAVPSCSPRRGLPSRAALTSTTSRP